MEQYNKAYLWPSVAESLTLIGFISNLPYSPADAALVAFPFTHISIHIPLPSFPSHQIFYRHGIWLSSHVCLNAFYSLLGASWSSI